MNSPQQAFILHKGMYQVHYTEGGVSRCMQCRTAKEYADIFGGIVKRHPYFKWWHLWVS